MPTNFPGALDTLTNPTVTSSLASPSHAGQHANINDAMEAVQPILVGRPWFNVRGYGATGDGTTDDTAAFNTARDAAGVNGAVYVPGGTYILAGPFQLSTAGQHWILHRNATLKLKAASNTHLLRVSASNVKVSGGRLDGNKANNTVANAGLFTLASAAEHCGIEDAEIFDSPSHGVFPASSNYGYVRRCRIYNNTSAGIGTTGGSPAHNLDISHNRIIGNGGKAIFITGDNAGTVPINGGQILGNHIETTAAFIAVEVFGYAHRYRVADNFISGGTMGISMDKSDDSIVSGNTVIGNGTNTNFGIENAGCLRLTVANNFIDLANKATGFCRGISTSASANSRMMRGFNYANNHVYRCTDGYYVFSGFESGPGATERNMDGVITGGVIWAPVAKGIYIQQCDRIQITGVVVNKADSAGATTDGVYIESAKDISVIGCRFRDLTNGLRYFLGGTASGAGLSVTNIMVHSNRFDGVTTGINENGVTVATKSYKINLPTTWDV